MASAYNYESRALLLPVVPHKHVTFTRQGVIIKEQEATGNIFYLQIFVFDVQ